MTAAVVPHPSKRVHIALGGALAARAVIGHLALPLLAVLRGLAEEGDAGAAVMGAMGEGGAP